MGSAGRALTVLAIAMSLLVALSGPALAANLGSSISRGTNINQGDYLSRQPINQSYRVQLIMQRDGNLVLKRTTGFVCWAAGTAGRGDHAVYQRDGNFVVVDRSGAVLWASGISSGRQVAITIDGDLMVGFILIDTC